MRLDNPVALRRETSDQMMGLAYDIRWDTGMPFIEIRISHPEENGSQLHSAFSPEHTSGVGGIIEVVNGAFNGYLPTPGIEYGAPNSGAATLLNIALGRQLFGARWLTKDLRTSLTPDQRSF